MLGLRKLWFAVAATTTTLLVAGCSSEAPSSDGGSSDELIGLGTPLPREDMVQIDAPPGMPDPWQQPDSTGVFDQHGKCGPTAVANALELYGIDDVSPDQADKDGVHFVVGSLALNLAQYFKSHQPQLDCEEDHTLDGPTFLRSNLDGGHPVMVWFNTAGGFLQSHWVVAVGHHGVGADEKVIVMSWGAYYEIPMEKLDDAWRLVLGLPHPAVVCKATTKLIVR